MGAHWGEQDGALAPYPEKIIRTYNLINISLILTT